MQSGHFKEKSFWLSTRDYTPGRPLQEDAKLDVAIVGGGFTGLSAAYHLKKTQPGLRIAILESQVIGYGASGRNGGFNMTLFGLTLGITAIRFGKRKAKQAHHYMEKAVDLLRDLVHDLGLDCDYEHPGFLRVATSEKYRARIMEEIELAHKLGLEGIEWIEKEQLDRQVRSPMYLGAWWEPRCGILNPAKLAWSWRDVLIDMGIEIYESTPVGEMSRSQGKVALQIPGATVVADKVVMATNAWSHFFPELSRKQIPVWTHIVLTEPLSAEQFASIGWKNRQGIEDARNLVHYYRLTADNRLLMGGRDVSITEGTDMERDLNPATFAGLKDDVRTLFPTLENIRFTHEWGGPVSVPLDMAPALGYLGDKNVVYSLGCVGHGVSLTHLNGKTLCDMILERQTERTEVFFVNRRTLPWPSGVLRNIAIKAILGYMHWEDRRFDDPAGPAAN
ncbi:FAD-dependent oxidoreductase [uncultured Desulfosarcina sp.]|uniref:NAD(P)/FAD-dependent oxidoreductase n=1 Tax=uncultured Desulfosarcina sp. TaxID=218289 RepID=UPI0029C69919|nr:FAD-dependent oxidoreductase [uncultured Desulfosarcina sp.]